MIKMVFSFLSEDDIEKIQKPKIEVTWVIS